MISVDPSPSHHPRANLCGGRPVVDLFARLSAGVPTAKAALEFGVHLRTVQAHCRKHEFRLSEVRGRQDCKARAARIASAKRMAAGIASRPAIVAFVEAHRDQFTAAELAAAVGLTRNAVIGIWHRARQR